jgi:large subunit ribosomal protein L15
VDTLAERFEADEEVTMEALLAKRLIKGRPRKLKVLGRGELNKALTVHAHRFTKQARGKIEGAGGKAEVV